MSKRFGRNQKRKMREELSNLEYLKNESEGLKNYYRDKFHDYELRLTSWAKRMNHLVGPEHPLNEEIHRIFLKRNPNIHERFKFMKPTRLSLTDALDKSLSDPYIASEFIQTVLHTVDLRRDTNTFRVIVQLLAPDKQCYYAIDDQILYEGRTDPKFIYWLSESIAHKLSEHIAN